jgi:hypothetical protein
LGPRRGARRHTPATEERLALRHDIRRRIADIETGNSAPFHLAGDEAARICIAKGKRFRWSAHEREIANAIPKHQRAAGERTQDIDDDRNAARVRGAREQTPSFNSHCCHSNGRACVTFWWRDTRGAR